MKHPDERIEPVECTGKVTESLHARITALQVREFMEDVLGPGRARTVVRRTEQRNHLLAGGVRTDFLAESLGVPVSHLLMTFDPGASVDLTENDEFESPQAGESFYLVMQGELLVELAGREAVVLTEGDSITLRHQDFRRSRNVSSRRTVVYVSRVSTEAAGTEAPEQEAKVPNRAI